MACTMPSTSSLRTSDRSVAFIRLVPSAPGPYPLSALHNMPSGSFVTAFWSVYCWTENVKAGAYYPSWDLAPCWVLLLQEPSLAQILGIRRRSIVLWLPGPRPEWVVLSPCCWVCEVVCSTMRKRIGVRAQSVSFLTMPQAQAPLRWVRAALAVRDWRHIVSHLSNLNL